MTDSNINIDDIRGSNYDICRIIPMRDKLTSGGV